MSQLVYGIIALDDIYDYLSDDSFRFYRKVRYGESHIRHQPAQIYTSDNLAQNIEVDLHSAKGTNLEQVDKVLEAAVSVVYYKELKDSNDYREDLNKLKKEIVKNLLKD